MYLAAAGIGRLVLFDGDVVDLTNLQRQIAHTTARIGHPKASSAAQTLAALNPLVSIEAHDRRLEAAELAALLPGIDIVLDCSDNRATRYAVNRACVAASLPLVWGSASGFSGQLAVHDLRRSGEPCYACLFPEGPGEDEACATTGVFAPLTGVIGALQAAEALRVIGQFGEHGGGALLTVDARDMAFQRLRFARDPRCLVCAGPR
jgi:molybdopterin/thiamine biosynthesis adenylyltransferase